MRLTTKGRFAVTAMIDIALRDGGGPVTLSDISQPSGPSTFAPSSVLGKFPRRRFSKLADARAIGGSRICPLNKRTFGFGSSLERSNTQAESEKPATTRKGKAAKRPNDIDFKAPTGLKAGQETAGKLPKGRVTCKWDVIGTPRHAIRH